MTPPNRASEDGSDSSRTGPGKRDALIQAGVHLFSLKPYEDVSVDELTTHANVAHGMVSYHFGSKRRLFADTVAFVWADFVEFERPPIDEVTPSQLVRGFLRRYFDYTRRYPERFALMRATHGDESVREILHLAKAEAMHEIAAALGCPTEAPPLVAAAIWGWQACLDGMALQRLADPSVDIDALIEMGVQALVALVNAANGAELSAETEQAALMQIAHRPDESSVLV